MSSENWWHSANTYSLKYSKILSVTAKNKKGFHRLGDTIDKMLALQSQGPEFEPQNLQNKTKHPHVHIPKKKKHKTNKIEKQPPPPKPAEHIVSACDPSAGEAYMCRSLGLIGQTANPTC